MSKLNNDVLFLIFKELSNDKKSLYSCLLVDRTWCKATISILWKNPLKLCPNNNARNILFNVVLLHLSKESRDILKNQGIDLFTETYQQPLFNYISFWRYLSLFHIERVITSVMNMMDKSKISILKNEIIKLFVNRNTKFTHLYLRSSPCHQIYLIPGAENCFSELKFLQSNNNNDQNSLEELARIIKSVEALKFHIKSSNDNSGIIKFIEAQKNLTNVRLVSSVDISQSFHKALEESLIKHANTIRYLRIRWMPITKILSYFVNLISLDLSLCKVNHEDLDWSHLENVSLHVLKILKAQWIPFKILENLIKSTNGHLTEISICYSEYGDCWKMLIQKIYQNCPTLRYLRFHLNLNDSNISELEKLLINCQCLDGLVITHYKRSIEHHWDKLFEALTKSSPTGLFKFKFYFGSCAPKLESMKLFFDNWKDRHPMLLHFIPTPISDHSIEGYFNLVEEYKAMGTIKKYDDSNSEFEEFEWIKKFKSYKDFAF